MGARHNHEMWRVVDGRNMRPVTVGAYFTKESAEADIENWRRRDARGGRPDVSHLMPHLLAVRQQDIKEGITNGSSA